MNGRIEHVNWGLLATLVFGFLLAAVLGVRIAHSDYLSLLYIVGVFSLVAYAVYWKKFTWQIALLLGYLGFTYRPLGFEFTSTEITCGLGALLALVTVWQRRASARIGILQHRSFNLLRLFLLLWFVYVAIHMIYNISDPLRPTEFVLRNALKSYFAPFAPAVMLWYFSGNPTAIRTDSKIMPTLAILMLIGLVFNLAITCYGIVVHASTTDPDNPISYATTLSIPVINAKDNPYVLRALGPGAVLFGTMVAALGWRQTGVPRVLAFLLLVLGSLGCLLSGGRAAVATAIVLLSSLLLLTRRILALSLILVAAGLLILLTNLFSDWVNREAPLVMARPLQWVMVNKSSEASESIQNSSRWRKELFKMAITEWQSEPRIFWFGRATYGFGVGDFLAERIFGGFESLKETSLRRGVTHNLLSDLLVTYGLIGCILYYLIIFSILRFLWAVYQFPDMPPVARPLSLLCFISSAAYLVIASVGGGYYPVETMWLLILLIALLYRYRPDKASTERPAPAFDILHDRAA